MSKTFLSLLMLSFCLERAAFASPICETLSECLAFQTKVAERIREISPQPTVLKSVSGHLFKRVLDHPELGEAWQDESGIIWGDIVFYDNGVSKKMSQQNAAAYCNSIGAVLPTSEQLLNLGKYLGEGGDGGYVPEILPHITYIFWSRTVSKPGMGNSANFEGTDVLMNIESRLEAHAVRCVSP